MTDSFSKLTKAIPTTKTTATAVATIFLERLGINFDVPIKVLTDNGPQFTSKVFSPTCAQHSVKAIKTTEYHTQANRQVKRFNQAVLSTL